MPDSAGAWLGLLEELEASRTFRHWGPSVDSDRETTATPAAVNVTLGCDLYPRGLCDKCVPAAVYNTMLHDLVRTVHAGAGLFESWQ